MLNFWRGLALGLYHIISNIETYLAPRICKKKNALSSGYQCHMGHLILTNSPWSIFPWITQEWWCTYLERNEAKVGHPFQWNLFNLESSYNKCKVRSIFEILLKSGELVLIFGTSLRSLSFSSVRRSGEISSIPKTNDNCLPDS